MWFLVLVFVVILLLVIVYRLEQSKYPCGFKIPGPTHYPLIGNALDFGADFAENNVEKLHNFNKDYGAIMRIWPIFLKPVIIVCDADAVQAILTSNVNITKARDYEFMIPWLGTGLLISTGAKWQKRRKLLTPAFHFKILEDFISVFEAETDSLIKKFGSLTSANESIDIYPIIKRNALEIICKTAMGISLNTQAGNAVYSSSVQNILSFLKLRIFSVWKNFDCLYQFSSEKPKLEKEIEIVHNFTNGIIKDRKQILDDKDAEGKNDEEYSYKKKFAFLDLLIKASNNGKDLSDEDIREEVDTFTFEGHDTISSGLSFTLYEIARHPEIQDKIYEELDAELCGSTNDKLTYQNLQNLNYLGLVIKEGLRMYPPVNIYERTLEEEVKLGDYVLDKGVIVIINAYSLHREEKYYSNPDEFIPERFHPDVYVEKHPFCYVPFSAGPRNCIGQKFAILEMKMVIARILLNFKLLPDPSHKIKLTSDAVLKSATGMKIKLEPRKP